MSSVVFRMRGVRPHVQKMAASAPNITSSHDSALSKKQGGFLFLISPVQGGKSYPNVPAEFYHLIGKKLLHHLFVDKSQVKWKGYFDWLRSIIICPLGLGILLPGKKNCQVTLSKREERIGLRLGSHSNR